MENKKRWYLYILRYSYSGNYYVGVTPTLNSRMNIHLKRTSANNKRLPTWSYLNKSIQGFRAYWYDCKDSGVSQSTANKLENKVTRQIEKRIVTMQNGNVAYSVIGGDLTRQKDGYDPVNQINNALFSIDPVIIGIDTFLSGLHQDAAFEKDLDFISVKDYR